MGHPAEHRDNRGAAEFAEKKNPRPTLKKRGWGTRQTRRVGHPAESGRLTRSSLTAQSSQRRRTQDPPSKNEDGAPGRKRKAKQPDRVGVNADAEGAEKMNPRAQSGMTVPQEEPKTHPQKTRMGHPADAACGAPGGERETYTEFTDSTEFAEKKNPRPTLKKRGWGTRQRRGRGIHRTKEVRWKSVPHPDEAYGRKSRASRTPFGMTEKRQRTDRVG